MNIKSKLRKLIKNRCATYSPQELGINHFCHMLDSTCLFFRNNEKLPRCKYFEQGVLPLDGELESEYYSIHDNESTANKPKPTVKCSRCGLSFKANSNRQKYCDKCKEIVKREQASKRKQKSRNKQVNE